MTALSQQLLTQTRIKASLLEMGAVQLVCAQEDSSGPHRANKGISKAGSRDAHAVCTLWVHPPTSPCPALSAEAEPWSLQEVTSQDAFFMPDILGYTHHGERVKCYYLA